MRTLLAVAALLAVAGTAAADQKSEARRALGSGQGFQPSGYQVDGPTYYVNEGGGQIRHVRDPRQPSKHFWHDNDRANGGTNAGEAAPSK